MPATYCEVALPVPLRTAFTYAIPERLADTICVGSRVLVSFRNRAMTGVVVAISSRRPDPQRVRTIKEIVRYMKNSSGEMLYMCPRSDLVSRPQ